MPLLEQVLWRLLIRSSSGKKNVVITGPSNGVSILDADNLTWRNSQNITLCYCFSLYSKYVIEGPNRPDEDWLREADSVNYNGMMALIGGNYKNNISDEIHIFNPNTETWNVATHSAMKLNKPLTSTISFPVKKSIFPSCGGDCSWSKTRASPDSDNKRNFQPAIRRSEQEEIAL